MCELYKIQELIKESLKEVIFQHDISAGNEINLDTKIIGNSNTLDSLQFISFIVNLEQKLKSQMNINKSLITDYSLKNQDNVFGSILSLSEFINSSF